MSKQTAASLFILPPSLVKSAELYQALLHGIESYQELGNRLIRLAEQAHAFRQFDKVRELGMVLSHLPVKSYQGIGHYFLAVATHRVANGDRDIAKRLFELAANTAPDVYKSKAVASLGALSIRGRDLDSAFYYYREAIKISKLSAEGLHEIKAISVLKAMEGNHREAVKDLESILPMLNYTPAHVYFDVLNSYAVELGEVGRKDEARNIMRIVLASPFARVYPEWRETAEDLKPSRRSFVAVGSSPYNVLTMPEREHSEQIPLQPKPARVLNFARLKKKMDKKDKDKQTKKAVEDMTRQDLGFELIGLITENHASDEQLRQLVYFAMTLFSEPDEPDPDKPAS
jgi:tetratricopeptide (TPR) repeat protein